MSLLSKATSGIEKKPPFILLYGTPKIGKTTFASKAPSPIILDIEQGSHLINMGGRLTPTSYDEVIKILTELASSEHLYKAIILDSLDHLEPLVWSEVCKRSGKASIEDVGGGFQKGYVEALREWGQIISLLKECRDKKGMMIICIAHVHTKTINDPTQIASYDKFELKFHPKASALFKENADAILFARQELLVAGGDQKKKGKAVGDGKRVLHTQGMPGYEAGNRYNLPAEMDLDFDQVYALIRADKKEVSSEDLKKKIIAMTSTLESKLKENVLKSMTAEGENIGGLKRILDKLLKLSGSKK